MATNKTDGERFAQYLREKQFKADLENHPWTLRAVEEFERDMTMPTGDAEQDAANVRFFESVKASSIAASNARGDFLWPHQMNPKQFAEHVGAGGKPVYSLADYDIVTRAVGGNEYANVNTPLTTAWREEFKRAYAEGRVMRGPGGESDRRLFPGETEVERAKRLNTLGVLMESSVKARENLEASLARIRELQGKNVDPGTVRDAVLNEAAKVAPAVRQTVGVAFDVRGSDEFHAFDRLVTEAGGSRSWRFDDA